MSGEYFFMKILAVCDASETGDLLRQGASAASITVEVSNVSIAAACRALSHDDVDAVFLDVGISQTEQAQVIDAAYARKLPPFTFLLAPSRQTASELVARGGLADGIMLKPGRLSEAKALIETCINLKVPSRLLMVDDSSTMRSIIRKILDGCRFPLEIVESTDGAGALDRLNAGKVDFVFLDYNMPGLDGIQLLTEIKRQHPEIGIVMMTSAADEALAERACAAGAAAFLKKPFYSADIDAVFYTVHGIRPLKRSSREQISASGSS
jgi:CheY-like chemotaxis protein